MTTFLTYRDMTMHRWKVGALLVSLALLAPAQPTAGQAGTADSLRAVINATRARSAAAARVFLDSSRTAAERERATADVRAFLDSADARAALRVAGNSREPERIRVLALAKGSYVIDGDTAAESALLSWIGDRNSPPMFRAAAMNTLMALMVGSTMRHRRAGEIDKLLRALSVESDSLMRRSALAWLVTARDSATIGRLIRALRPNGDPVVAPSEAVVLLGTSGSAEAKAAMRPLLAQRDIAARTELIRVLGSDPASAPALDALVADSREPDSVRATALGAVFANRPHDFPRVSLPLVSDENAGDDLRVFAIDAVRLRATAPLQAMKISPSTAFDTEVRRLERGSRSPRVRAAAAAYARDVRP